MQFRLSFPSGNTSHPLRLRTASRSLAMSCAPHPSRQDVISQHIARMGQPLLIRVVMHVIHYGGLQHSSSPRLGQQRKPPKPLNNCPQTPAVLYREKPRVQTKAATLKPVTFHAKTWLKTIRQTPFPILHHQQKRQALKDMPPPTSPSFRRICLPCRIKSIQRIANLIHKQRPL